MGRAAVGSLIHGRFYLFKLRFRTQQTARCLFYAPTQRTKKGPENEASFVPAVPPGRLADRHLPPPFFK